MVSGPVEAAPPEVDFAPLQSPLPEQEVALLLTAHVKLELPPTATDIGLDVNVTTGFCGLVTVSGILLA